MAALRRLWDRHLNLVSWFVLALGMVAVVIFAARGVGFKPGQWAALIATTVALAGLCVWIISWEDGADETEAAAPKNEELASNNK